MALPSPMPGSRFEQESPGDDVGYRVVPQLGDPVPRGERDDAGRHDVADVDRIRIDGGVGQAADREIAGAQGVGEVYIEALSGAAQDRDRVGRMGERRKDGPIGAADDRGVVARGAVVLDGEGAIDLSRKVECNCHWGIRRAWTRARNLNWIEDFRAP
jgi:hypothetical protein